MTQAIIREAFETRLKTWADARTPALPYAWENVPFTPTAGARYVRATLLPAPTLSATLDRGHRNYRGIFQVSFHMPVGIGAGAFESLLASLDSTFAASFTQDGVLVYLTKPFSAAPAIQDKDRYVVPVSCEYAAHTV
jgi:hypothetical protein